MHLAMGKRCAGELLARWLTYWRAKATVPSLYRIDPEGSTRRVVHDLLSS